jgi:hypothetical protein
LHRMRHRRWQGMGGRHNFLGVGQGFERTTFKYGDRGVGYAYVAAGHASLERVSCRQNRSISAGA